MSVYNRNDKDLLEKNTRKISVDWYITAASHSFSLRTLCGDDNDTLN